MKKTIILILGLILILLIGGVVYMMLFGTPKNTAEIFTNFRIGGNNDQEYADVTGNTPETAVDIESEKLQQLTTRPVAGAGFTKEGIRYVEQGTGHVYEIDLRSGEETLISGTTIPKTTDAIFSTSTDHVVITSFDSEGTATVIGTISTSSTAEPRMRTMGLPDNATEFGFSKTGSALNYLIKSSGGSTGHRYDLVKRSTADVFNLPLRDIRVLWGSPVYVYTTPTASQIGHVYKLGTSNALSYVTKGLSGLVATQYQTGVAITSVTDEGVTSKGISNDGIEVPHAQPIIPEKCVSNPLKTERLFCSTPQNIGEGVFPDSWYMGSVSYEDILWDINAKTGESLVLLNFLTESGREVDVKKIGTDLYGTKLYFINKNDNTLWMFDRSID